MMVTNNINGGRGFVLGIADTFSRDAHCVMFWDKKWYRYHDNIGIIEDKNLYPKKFSIWTLYKNAFTTIKSAEESYKFDYLLEYLTTRVQYT